MIESIEEQRALQLALELSLLGLNPDQNNISNSEHSNNVLNMHTTNGLPTGLMMGIPDGLPGPGPCQPQPKKSQNTTECVPVPSSEHVAEIVGRQGCKIKALRAKTNTYIKTPVRGEEPVFVVTGRKEDVANAKREILSAAEHFSQIRAQRKNSNGIGPNPNANVPGQTTIQVRVPYRVVGLVVGPKGATIKRIQQNTNTYIITPSREKEPIFEVTGLPDQVERARSEIEAHIALRTGGVIDSRSIDGSSSEETLSNEFNLLGGRLDHNNGLFTSPSLFGSENGFTLNGFKSNGIVNGHGLGALCSKSTTMTTTSATNGGSQGTFNGFDPSVISSTISSSSRNTNPLMDGRLLGGDPIDFFNPNGPQPPARRQSNGFNPSFPGSDSDEGIAESPTFDTLNGHGLGAIVGNNTLSYSSVWSDNGIGTGSTSSCAASSISSTSKQFTPAISPPSRRSSSIGSPSDISFPVTINGSNGAQLPAQGQTTQTAQGQQHNGSELCGSSTSSISSNASGNNVLEYFNGN